MFDEHGIILLFFPDLWGGLGCFCGSLGGGGDGGGGFEVGVYLVIGEALRHDGRLYEVYSGKVSGGRVVMVFQVVECDCEVSLYRNGD